MHRAVALLPVKTRFAPIYNFEGLGGFVPAVTPKKQEHQFGEGGEVAAKEKNDPIVAFSKPPPIPPVLGPLVLLSLWDSWTSRDSNEN